MAKTARSEPQTTAYISLGMSGEIFLETIYLIFSPPPPPFYGQIYCFFSVYGVGLGYAFVFSLFVSLFLVARFGSAHSHSLKDITISFSSTFALSLVLLRASIHPSV